MSEYPVTSVHFADYERDRDGNKTCGKCSFLHCSSLTRSMDVFSMIKHSIISDEANPITRYFDIRQHVGSCGPDMIWKIFHAYRIEDNKVKLNFRPSSYLVKTSAGNILKYFSIFPSETVCMDFQRLFSYFSFGDSLHGMSKSVFLEKIKNIAKCYLLKFLPSMLRVNGAKPADDKLMTFFLFFVENRP